MDEDGDGEFAGLYDHIDSLSLEDLIAQNLEQELFKFGMDSFCRSCIHSSLRNRN